MIKQIVKDYRTNSFNSAKDVLEKINYFRSISKKGIHNLSEKEIEDLKKEFFEFFNLKLAFSAPSEPTKLFRISNNMKIYGSKVRLQKISDLLAPPPEKSFYNRCNLPNERVFYAALDLTTAIWETKPKAGDYITVSEWKIKEGKKLNMHSIFHPRLTNVNSHSQFAFEQFLEHIKQLSQDKAYILEEVLLFFTEEFMKKVDEDNKQDYFFSAINTSRFLQSNPDNNGFKVEAINYPSVKMNLGATNIAIANNLVLEKLELVSIKTYDILETNFDETNLFVTDILSFSPFVIKSETFDYENDKIIYNLEDELNEFIDLHQKYLFNEND